MKGSGPIRKTLPPASSEEEQSVKKAVHFVAKYFCLQTLQVASWNWNFLSSPLHPHLSPGQQACVDMGGCAFSCEIFCGGQNREATPTKLDLTGAFGLQRRPRYGGG